jgi:hypothetical protein
MSGRVIQGFFIGGRIPVAVTGPFQPVVQRKSSTGTPTRRPAPGPPPAAFGAAARPAQARAAPGRPPVAHRGPALPIQRHGGDASFPIDAVQLGLARNGGAPLPMPLLAKMEAAFGADFSAVRVHVGPQAARIGAIAFTTGNDLYFAPGRYQPGSAQGQQLIGHELAHVIQQRQGRVRAPGSGVAVVQDHALEAEADRLGMRAAMHRAPLAASPLQRSAIHRMAGPPGTALQRMQEPSFPITSDARQFLSQHNKRTRQDDLDGRSQAHGRTSHRDHSHINTNKRRKYVHAGGKDSSGKKHSAGVVSFLKFNGKYISMGENEKAGPKMRFEHIGFENFRGTKDNFHAEDWSIQSFKSQFALSKYDDMEEWLEDIGHDPSSNTGQGGRHVISVIINYSSCMGCVTTIREFHTYLTGHLGKDNFLLRVKFLRPYDFPVTITRSGSTVVKNFISGIGALREKGIYVRMQSEASVRRFLGTTIDIGILSTIAVNHKGVVKALSKDQYDYLTQTWTLMRANRKGITVGKVGKVGKKKSALVKPPATLYSTAKITKPVTVFCNKPTKGKTLCKRKIKPGGKCPLHG